MEERASVVNGTVYCTAHANVNPCNRSAIDRVIPIGISSSAGYAESIITISILGVVTRFAVRCTRLFHH